GAPGRRGPQLGRGRRAGARRRRARRPRFRRRAGRLMARPTTLRAAAPGLLRVLRRFAPHVRRERALIAGGGAALLAEVLLRLAEPWPLKFVLDRVIVNTPGATGGWVARLDPTTLLLLCALGVVAAVGLRA